MPPELVVAFVEMVRAHVARAASIDVLSGPLRAGFLLLDQQLDARELRLHGPDMQTLPLRAIDDVAIALHTMLEHRLVPASFGVVEQPCHMDDRALVQTELPHAALVMARSAPRAELPHDSGWFFANLDHNNAAELRVMSLYELVTRAPHVLPYLSLPVDTQVTFRDTHGAVHVHGQLRAPTPHSYAAARLAPPAP